jgi:hypothetical protein
MYRFVVLLGLVFCGVAPSPAQTADSADQQETIKALLREVQELKARVAALEARPQAPVETAAKPPAEAPPHQGEAQPAETTAQQGPASDGEAPRFSLAGIKLQGFGAATFKVNDARPPESGALLGFRPGSSGNFAVGDVDLFLTSQLTAKTRVLTEIAFSEQPTGEFETDVERVLLNYSANDYLKMSFGRFHTSTSYYNSVFHHGLWLQTAVDRPIAVEFSDHGGLMPSQAIGASVTGKIPSGGLGLNYVMEFGTAKIIRPAINGLNAPQTQQHNGNEITGGLFMRPDWLPGLDIGGSFYHDRINPATDGVPLGLHIEQSATSLHAVYVTPRFEFLSEAFFIQHKIQETNKTFNTPAFYALISQKLGTSWRPFFRYQYANAGTNSPLFADVGLRHGPSTGIRYDLNDYIAFKAQYDRTMRRGLTGFNQFLSQLAFHF